MQIQQANKNTSVQPIAQTQPKVSNNQAKTGEKWVDRLAAFLLGSGVVLGVVAIYVTLRPIPETIIVMPPTTEISRSETTTTTTQIEATQASVIAEPAQVDYYPYERTIGTHYLSDILVFITKQTPRQALFISINRTENNSKDFYQNSAVSFFDGQDWQRLKHNITTHQAEVATNPLITNWQIGMEEPRVTGEVLLGQVVINDYTIDFMTSRLENEMVVRSWPGYTKLLSSGEGILAINGQQIPVYTLYTQLYSLASEEIQFYDTHIPLETVYIAFWDEAGNFYHVDQTLLDAPTSVYQSHQIGI